MRVAGKVEQTHVDANSPMSASLQSSDLIHTEHGFPFALIKHLLTSTLPIFEKERQKAEKLAKFKEKQSKQQVNVDPAPQSKVKKFKKFGAADAYEPKRIESGRYEWWETRGLFHPQFTVGGAVKHEGKFVIPIPPPNVTGALHMGHALTNALQDTMVRHVRMRGKTMVWIPGCDHASISTQSVVEKMLWRMQRKKRHDVGRVRLLEMLWDWTEKYKGNITNQLRRLGGSMDWTR
jgi:valyl-tRNA synthetase